MKTPFPPMKHGMHPREFTFLSCLAVVSSLIMAGVVLSNTTPKSTTQEITRVEYGKPALTVCNDLCGMFRSFDAGVEYFRLKKAGANPGTYLDNLVCAVPTDTRVMVMGFSKARDVLVINGPDAGCRGIIAEDQLRPEVSQ